MRLREIPRTAAFAWSPGAGLPLIVSGTRAGAVDADFSDETKLELWDLSLDSSEQGVELPPIASISTDSRFHDIAWAPANEQHPRGIIAGALENGSLDLWDAEKLINGDSDAFMSRTTKHTGAIKSLQFNPLKPQILATAGTKGELYIYDVNDISNPFRLGTAQARADDLECVAWNRKVPHILATGAVSGFVTVWDLKTKKASLTLNSRKPVGAVAWDPNNATKLLTATPDDNTPTILLWDLRNSNAPERTLQGHDQGILSLSWCQLDSDLLLSSGKDNRTICWNPQTGELVGEFPESTNWTFQTRFNPHNPNLSATASFEGKITIQTLQNTNPAANQAAAQGPTDGEDFFAKAQTQPQGASFSLKRAPKWMERPVGASFGFGGKLLSFSLQAPAAGQVRSSRIQISTFSVDSGVESATESFETALKAGDISSICQTHVAEAKDEDEKADWKVIETLIAANPRAQVTEYLGFGASEDTTDDADGDEKETLKDGEEVAENGVSEAKKNRLSTFFADGADNDDFLADIAATKGTKTDNPFELFSHSDSAPDRQITRALMLGQFEKAMTICLKEDRMADAFMVANCGGQALVLKAQTAYLSRKTGGPRYLRLLSAVVGKNLWDVVYNADLANWKEAMATLCTYADPAEFPDLCEALGDRIAESGSRKDASFCYLVGSKLEKVISIWIDVLKEHEQAGVQTDSEDTTFSLHARSLQNFIEKVTVFREVTKFDDKERNLSSDWKLAPLYDRYIEYSDIVAAHGHLATAEKYLNLLPAQYPAAEVARNRVKLATRSAAPQSSTRSAQATSSRTPARAQPVNSFQPQPVNTFQPQQQAPSAAPTSAVNPYAPPNPLISNAYAPQNPTGGYAPQGYMQQPAQSTYAPPSIPTPMGFNQGPPQNFGAPPRNTTPGSVPPPSRAKDMVQWNDTPMVTKPAVARRGTPSQPPITSPFPNQGNLSMPPSAPPFGGPRGTPTPPPPPPKASGPPRVTSPLNNGAPPAFQQVNRSASGNLYAPPQQSAQPVQQLPSPTIARGASPYNAPPSAPPPTNRYAPAPSTTQQSQPPGQIAPPPAGSRPPPPANPYAPAQSPAAPQAPFRQPSFGQPAPPQQQYGHPAQAPPQGPPQGPPRGLPHGPPQGPLISRPGTAQSGSAKPAAAPKHPSGDRSHIPPKAQPMVDIFSADMQRVAGKAPPSFAAQVKDTQKRLTILFDHLNNGELVRSDTVTRLGELAEALQGKDFETAARLQAAISMEKADECGNWMVGVKRLISMSKVTP